MTERTAALNALADRVEREGPSAELDVAIAYAMGREVEPANSPAAHYTSRLTAARSLQLSGWLLITLSASDGMPFCRLADTGSPAREAIGCALTIEGAYVAAALRAIAMEIEHD